MSDKEAQLRKVSNFRVVKEKGRKLGLDVLVSTRKGKKYMVRNPETGKLVHFGDLFMEDYTKHLDKERRERFRTRNARFKGRDRYSPAYLSYWLLW